ncbi:mechanosensitive ion channel family protein [Lichenihabitans psoromatis]|uniref:mechanosensitive ion channel family protein n=1 Tax=Lichenihabitans psoromatis TaxID=2528642 RepID=UPI001038494A|nr:mechanosensitive ion channel family protein [Lichenihabitans psoromatis]
MTHQTLLLIATLVLCCGVAVPRLLRRWSPLAKVGWRVVLLIIFTVLMHRIVGSPLQPTFHSDLGGQRLWEQLLEAGWWMVTARGIVGLARLIVVLENRPRETQIISDLMAATIYLATALAVVDLVFDVSIGGLLATSGVIAIVLGLALQSTLSDVFSGIAVGIERPYKAGDLLWVEGGIEGHVLQVNWRSTQIATGNGNIAIVPNSVIAKARLINHSRPTPVRGDAIEIRLDPGASPELCIATLHAAILACRLPLTTPPPSIARTQLRGDGVVYEIYFSVPSTEKLGAARSEVFGQVQRHLRHAGLALAVAGIATVPRLAVPTPAELLAQSDLFGAIDPEERDLLAQHLTQIHLARGDMLIRQDDEPRALFIVASGTVEITRRTPTGETPVIFRMSPGGSLGAIGLITGAPYGATATALTQVTAYRLDKAAIAAAVKIRPELAAGLEAVAARGQAALAVDVVAHRAEDVTHPEQFLDRMRSFLRKLAVQDAA